MVVVLAYNLKTLIRDHPVATRFLLPLALSRFGGGLSGQIQIRVERRAPFRRQRDILITWDLDELAVELDYVGIHDDLRRLDATDQSPDERTMKAAEVVAMVVMRLLVGAKFTGRAPRSRRSRPTFADFYLDDTQDKMIEVAGRASGDPGGLFRLKPKQILRNSTLASAWVSVPVFMSRTNATGRVKP